MASPTRAGPDVRLQFGEWLKQRRKALGMSQEEAAKQAGIVRQQWMRLENGESGTRRETVPGIAFAIQASINETLERAGFSASPSVEEVRELELLYASVPEGKRNGFLRAVRVLAETLIAA